MKKETLFKKLFVLLLFFVYSFNHCYSYSTHIDELKNIPIKIFKTNNSVNDSRNDERSMVIPLVEAYYDTQRNEVECHLADIGTAHIYIVDIRGAVVDEKTVETDIPVYVTLATTSCVGGFYIVIDSDYVYAEGYSSL